MQRSRLMRPPRLVELALFYAFVTCGGATAAFAQALPVAPGAEALASARAAWDKGTYDTAELFYKSALDRGGLSPSEVVDCYVHLGAARAALKKPELSRAAFRQAARLDARFRVPPEAGRKAGQIAAMAKRDEVRVGSIVLRAQIPANVAANAPFMVDATLDAKHAASVVARIGIEARDAATGKRFNRSDVAATTAHFEVPAEVAAGGASLIVRVDALDAHDNRLASREQRVQVESPPAPPPPAVAPKDKGATIGGESAGTASSSSSSAPPAPSSAVGSPAKPALGLFETVPTDASRRRAQEPDGSAGAGGEKVSHGGFWSSPWTYVIAGTLLAAGGAAFYIVTRPTDNVSVGAARVQTH